VIFLPFCLPFHSWTKILLPALERHGHLKLEESIRAKVLAMSAATIDRLLRAARQATRTKKRRRVVPEIQRRVMVRTFADWHEPPPGSMEMDLVAHCGESTRGSYVHSLVLTDIASGWTECAPLVVRERTLLVETLDRIRLGLPFLLRALDVDNGGEFLNETVIEYCLRHGIELTRLRPYRKNDQAWIEQKNGAVVRKLVGYRRLEGIVAGQALARLYGASSRLQNCLSRSRRSYAKSPAASIRCNCWKKYAPCRVTWWCSPTVENPMRPLRRNRISLGSWPASRELGAPEKSAQPTP
jgi:integrase-like protein